MKILKDLSKNIDVILLSLVICINCLRVILGLGETTLTLYILYLLCVIFLFIKNATRLHKILAKDKTVKAFVIVIVLMVLYAIVSLAWIPSADVFSTFFKFLLSLVIGILAVGMSLDKIKWTINCVIAINVIYAILLMIIPGLADTAMSNGLNYLNVTLPLGLALTITLIKSLNAVSIRGGLLVGVFWIVLSALFFVAQVGFVARGVLLFPPLIAVLMFLFMRKEHKYVAWLMIPLYVGVLVLFYNYYLTNASDYAASRMLNLFESSAEEDRWGLWYRALNEMVDKLWFIMGGGIEAFRYNSSIHFYPHNIFIQVIGEYGLLGIIMSVMILWNIFKGFFKSRALANQLNESELLYCVFGAFAYYTLTFCKSFSLYEGLPLFVIIAFCLALFNQLHQQVGWGS